MMRMNKKIDQEIIIDPTPNSPNKVTRIVWQALKRITNEILTLSSSLISFIMWQVKELTGGKGANVIMEAVGGKVFTECLKW